MEPLPKENRIRIEAPPTLSVGEPLSGPPPLPKKYYVLLVLTFLFSAVSLCLSLVL